MKISKNGLLDFFRQLRTRYLAYFLLLTIIMNTTSRFKLLYTAPNQATSALASIIGLGLFGSKDQFGRERVKWGKYEASKIAEYPYQRILLYHQIWPNYETLCQSRIFDVCCFETKMPIYSVLDCLGSQKKLIVGKTGPKPYFPILIFIRKFGLPSFGPKTVALYRILWSQ